MTRLPERHEHEQYFFDDHTAAWVASLAARFPRPCLLCMPSVGALVPHATLLDIDERFASHPGFLHWDITRPEFVPGEPFDAILVDPPFFNVSLRQLERAVATLARHVPTTPVALTYVVRRADAVERALSRFGLQRTEVRATYRTVDESERNDIRWFANFDLASSES